MKNEIVADVETANKIIDSGRPLMIAGEAALLRKLKRGNWIGGSIPYFMGQKGAITERTMVQVVVLPSEAETSIIKSYSADSLSNIPSDYPSNGFSMIIIPGFSEAHYRFAKESLTWKGVLDRVLVGWVSGFHLDDVEAMSPMVMNGHNGEESTVDAVVIHVSLPATKFAKSNIINLFEQGGGDKITFPETGFSVTNCYINGKLNNFSQYLKKNSVDLRLPLVADYFGAKINVSFQKNDESDGSVKLYAPVFEGVEYQFASPIGDYEAEFGVKMEKQDAKPFFTCNCVLNYLHAELEGKQTGTLVGPITFGEIAYVLLNQTLVYLTLEDRRT